MTNADNVRVAVTGAVYTADAGATVTAPTSSVSVLDTDLFSLGYCNEDGVEEEYDDDVEEIVAWQNGDIVRIVRSKSKATLKFTLIETRGKVLELYHPGSEIAVVSAGQWKMDVLTPRADRRNFVVDVLDGVKHIRFWVPSAEVSEREAIAYNGTDAVAYAVTLTVFPINGVVLTKFSDDANWGYS